MNQEEKNDFCIKNICKEALNLNDYFSKKLAQCYSLSIINFFFEHTDWLYSLAPSPSNLTYIKESIDPLTHNVQKLLDTL